MKIALIITAMLVCPGIIMGTISSYRAGQKPHRLLYLMIKKFTHSKTFKCFVCRVLVARAFAIHRLYACCCWLVVAVCFCCCLLIAAVVGEKDVGR